VSLLGRRRVCTLPHKAAAAPGLRAGQLSRLWERQRADSRTRGRQTGIQTTWPTIGVLSRARPGTNAISRPAIQSMS